MRRIFQQKWYSSCSEFKNIFYSSTQISEFFLSFSLVPYLIKMCHKGITPTNTQTCRMLNIYESLLWLILLKLFLRVFPLSSSFRVPIAKCKYYEQTRYIPFLVWNVVSKNVHFSLSFQRCFLSFVKCLWLKQKSLKVISIVIYSVLLWASFKIGISTPYHWWTVVLY